MDSDDDFKIGATTMPQAPKLVPDATIPQAPKFVPDAQNEPDMQFFVKTAANKTLTITAKGSDPITVVSDEICKKGEFAADCVLTLNGKRVIPTAVCSIT